MCDQWMLIEIPILIENAVKTIFFAIFSADCYMIYRRESWNFCVTSHNIYYTLNFDEDLAFVSSIHTLLLLRWILINFLYCLRLFVIRFEHPPLCLTYFIESTSNVQSINRNSMNEVIHYLFFRLYFQRINLFDLLAFIIHCVINIKRRYWYPNLTLQINMEVSRVRVLFLVDTM